MTPIIGRILTGLCGGLLMAAFNHWNALTGWQYWTTIGAAFAVCFVAAMIVESRSTKKAAATKPAIDATLGSNNESHGNQNIDIGGETARAKSGTIGSGNVAGGDQTIKIG